VNELGVSIERDSISVLKETSPASDSVETVVCGKEERTRVRKEDQRSLFNDGRRDEELTNGDPRSLPLSNTSDTTHDVVNLGVAEETKRIRVSEVLRRARRGENEEGCSQRLHGLSTDIGDERLVEDSKHLNDVRVLRLRDELGDGSDVVEGSLSVRDSHLFENAESVESQGIGRRETRGPTCPRIRLI